VLKVAGVVVAALLVGTACAPDPPNAVVGIVVDSCDPGQERGSGMIIAPGLALTAAHVVAGADGIVVHHGGREAEATIIGFDPEMDLAYLSFDAVPTPVMPVDSSDVDAGDTGIAYVVRDGEVVPVPVRIRRRVNIRTEDIYIQGETMRPGLDLEAAIESGDSGGAVVVDGRIVGVIWARSNRFDRRAYAIDPVRAGDLITEQLRTGHLGDDVDIARCH
jgi:S1-C subfamily serine protease